MNGRPGSLVAATENRDDWIAGGDIEPIMGDQNGRLDSPQSQEAESSASPPSLDRSREKEANSLPGTDFNTCFERQCWHITT
ncbi:unnamed protein product [Cylicocyclus nassatus]|uniref:Uncharacterized protein n=1 Tax=Cylicocyclus nassatus TaxID=53992 RepID=A0AA36M6W9_CYLNA|nr:unnamed protein product [Cylicocyclus nassatus]